MKGAFFLPQVSPTSILQNSTINTYGSHDSAGKPASIPGRVGLSLFFLFFFAMGSLFEAFILREFGRAAGQRSWKRVPCTIVASEVQEVGGESPYAAAISYQYDYGDRRHSGSAYKRGRSACDTYSGAQKVVQKYPVGRATVCYVNPRNPAEAVLKRNSLLIGFAALFPLIFVAIGAGGIYFIWRKPPPAKVKPVAPIVPRTRGRSKYVTAAFFGLFAAAGGAMLYPLGIRPIARTIDAGNWRPTPCKVLRAEVRSHDSDDGTTYSVYILYEYECDGQPYKSDRYDFVGGSSSGYEGKVRVVKQYRTDPNPVCYVNPEDPTEAVLKRGFHAKLLLALFPLPFLLVGVGGMVYTLRGKKSGVWSPETLNVCSPTPASDPLSVLRPIEAGPAALKPKFSARGKLAGAILAAAFWNGIVAVFVAGAGLFMMIFLLPFIAVGIVLIGLVVYQFLALFNPRPALQLNPQTIPVGGAAELRWSFTGQTSRIRELRVTLRGVERATYRKGTSTCTDESTFYEQELFRTASLAEIASGQVGFVLPTDTMHSFSAENNKIIWRLDMRGEIQSWPDVKESFEIEVTPAAYGRQERHG
jgi:hypothetical protein